MVGGGFSFQSEVMAAQEIVSFGYGSQSREIMEVEDCYSAKSECYGAFERRRETSTKEWEESTRTYRETQDRRGAERAGLSMDEYALVVSETYGGFGRRLRGTWELTEHGKCGWRCHMDNRRMQETVHLGRRHTLNVCWDRNGIGDCERGTQP